MNLAHPRLTHTQYFTDLAQIQLFIVIKGQHQRLPLRQAGDVLGQGTLEALGRQIVESSLTVAVIGMTDDIFADAPDPRCR